MCQYFLNAFHQCEDRNLQTLLFYYEGGGSKCIHWPLRQMTHIRSKLHVTLCATHMWRWESNFVIVCLWQIEQMAAFQKLNKILR